MNMFIFSGYEDHEPMICFLDITFCSAKVHKPECDRQLTDEIQKRTDKIYLYTLFHTFDSVKIIYVNTRDDKSYPWFPNQGEMLERKWRVIT